MRLSITDFEFTFAGRGHYKVRYRTPLKRTKYDKVTDDMPLIDATKNTDNPKQKDLRALRRLCRS